jgi:hypothetical protein
MRKLYIAISILLTAAASSNAQNAATPNPGFENWTQVGNRFDPTDWNTLNPSTAILNVLTCTRATAPDVHSGTYAIKLTTKSVFGITANGTATTGKIKTVPPYGVSGGIAYAARPDSMVGWYKYSPASAADSAFIEYISFAPNKDTIGFARFYTPNVAVTSYQRFSVPISYWSAATPDTAYWLFTASDAVNPVLNSALYVDDIDLVFNTSGINSVADNNVFTVTNYINDNIIKVMNGSSIDAQLTITDASGRVIKTVTVSSGENNFSIDALATGVYYYQIIQAKQNSHATGKFIKL